MKKLNLVFLTLLSFTLTLSATSLKEKNENIKDEKNPAIKQVFKCERETMFKRDNGNPNICIKAVKMVKKMNKDSYSWRFYEGPKMISECYFNAGLIYDDGNKNADMAAKIYQKAIDENYGDKNIEFNLGILYFYGKSVQKNHLKAYKLFKSSLEHGSSSAQHALEVLCGQSPWACK